MNYPRVLSSGCPWPSPLLNDPKILFLDEPTIGLDPDVSLKTREIILDIITQTQDDSAVLTSHNMDEVESMCASEWSPLSKRGRHY